MSFLDRLFPKRPVKEFLAFTPTSTEWRVVSWNFDLKNSSHRLWSIETKGHGREQQIEWHRDGKARVTFFENKKIKTRANAREGDGMREMMNLAIHSTLKFSLESNHDFLLSPVSGATTLDFQNESKALMWLQGTFGTLNRAMDQMEGRPDLILTSAIFSGLEPQSGKNVFRIIIFNLDIFLSFNPDYSLHVMVFDDKNEGHGSSKNPTFQQIIKVTKPQIYDEIVKLVHRIATVGEI